MADIKLFLLISLIALISPSFALALEITYPTLPGGISLPDEPQLNEYVRYLYAFSIIISGFLALGVLIFSGVMRLLAAGNISRVANARQWMTAGFWGVIILLLSYIILATINPQLVGLKKVELEEKRVPPYTFSTRTPLPQQKETAFQIPMGKIIERAILAWEEKFSIGNKEFKNDTKFRQETKEPIQEISNSTGELNPELFELKQLIDACSCGDSICGSDCSPQGCNVRCNFSAIQDKANQIANSPVLPALEEKEKELAEYRNEVEKRNADLYKAIFLATIFFEDTLDYFSFTVERQEAENLSNREVEIETLPEWQDIKIFIKAEDGRIVADPATLYFWKKYKEMDDAIGAAGTIGNLAAASCPNTELPGGTICVPSNPGAFIWPAQAQGEKTLGYLDTKYPYGPNNPHRGIDIPNIIGTPVFAAANGQVVKVHTGCPPVPYDPDSKKMLNHPNAECGGKLGNHIIIEHKDFDPSIGTIYTTYAHLKDVGVKEGDTVIQRQQIGTMDTTGYVTGPHLHFVVSKDPEGNDHFDPATYLPGDGNTVCGPGGGGGGGTCEVITDPNSPCYVETLRPYFGIHAERASQICNAKGAKPFEYINDACKKGGLDYSIGPFQINLYRTCLCPGAWASTCEEEKALNRYTCPWPPRDKKKLDECAKNYGLGNADLHYKRAAEIASGGTNWCPWSKACPLYCNLCSDWNSCP